MNVYLNIVENINNYKEVAKDWNFYSYIINNISEYSLIINALNDILKDRTIKYKLYKCSENIIKLINSLCESENYDLYNNIIYICRSINDYCENFHYIEHFKNIIIDKVIEKIETQKIKQNSEISEKDKTNSEKESLKNEKHITTDDIVKVLNTSNVGIDYNVLKNDNDDNIIRDINEVNKDENNINISENGKDINKIDTFKNENKSKLTIRDLMDIDLNNYTIFNHPLNDVIPFYHKLYLILFSKLNDVKLAIDMYDNILNNAGLLQFVETSEIPDDFKELAIDFDENKADYIVNKYSQDLVDMVNNYLSNNSNHDSKSEIYEYMKYCVGEEIAKLFDKYKSI